MPQLVIERDVPGAHSLIEAVVRDIARPNVKPKALISASK